MGISSRRRRRTSRGSSEHDSLRATLRVLGPLLMIGGIVLFVAGVYDRAAGSYTLHWRTRNSSVEAVEGWREPDEALWIGAMKSKGAIIVDAGARSAEQAWLRQVASTQLRNCSRSSS